MFNPRRSKRHATCDEARFHRFEDPLPPPSIDLCDTATGRQTILSKDFNGFAFAPDRVLKPYLEDKEKHGKLDESKLSTLDKLN